MKTILMTTFAFALMVFAFNTNPVMAKAGWDSGFAQKQGVDDLKDLGETKVACSGRDAVYGCSNEDESTEEVDRDGFGGKAVADSGNEGSILEAGQRRNEVEGKDRGL